MRPGKAAISFGTNPLSRASKRDANAVCKIPIVPEASALDCPLANAGVGQVRAPFVPRLPNRRLAFGTSSQQRKAIRLKAIRFKAIRFKAIRFKAIRLRLRRRSPVRGVRLRG